MATTLKNTTNFFRSSWHRLSRITIRPHFSTEWPNFSAGLGRNLCSPELATLLSAPHHVVLDHAGLADEHVERLRDLGGVGKGESHEPRLQAVSPEDGEQRGEQHDEVAQHLQPDGQPPVGYDARLETVLKFTIFSVISIVTLNLLNRYVTS